MSNHQLQNFMVTMMILEGRHYVWQNMNSAVIIKIDNKKRTTHVQHHTDSPFYNEYFVFEFFTTLESFLDKNITVTVMKPKSFCNKRKILGSFNLDLATIWAQKHHQFFHKWAVLTSPKSDIFGTTGFLKIDVCVLSKGEEPLFPTHITNDEIEGNLLLPSQDIKERQKANFIFEIYRCENLNFKPSTDVREAVKLPLINYCKQPEAGPTTFVEVTFAGHSERTAPKKHTIFPTFNERLIISDMFPPLSQRAKLEICPELSKKSCITHYLNLKAISCETTSGFLPTFGPSYIYLYSDQNLEGYIGCILVSMATELEDSASIGPEVKKATIKNIRPLNEQALFVFENTFLFATIFEATTIIKKYSDKPISFRLSIGHVEVEKITTVSGDGAIANSSVPKKPTHIKKGVYYIDFLDKKPCLRLHSRWPDLRKRLYNSNMLARIAMFLKNKLDLIEEFLARPQRHKYYDQLDTILLDTLDNFTAAIKKYIDVISNNYNTNHSTKLDKERIAMLSQEMERYLKKTHTLYNNKSRKHVFYKLYNLYKKLEIIMEDPQWCYPDIVIWMICGFKKVSYVRIPARRLIYSPIEEERGQDCGKRIMLSFKAPGKHFLICKLDILLWFGLEKQQDECLPHIPESFRYEGEFVNCRQIWSDEKYLFTCRAHIFEAKLQPGYDQHGLVDGFVQIIVADRLKETKVIAKSLSPMWDQMLEIPNILVYGSKDYIRQNPPLVVIQLYNRDKCGLELLGRNTLRPVASFLNDECKPPVKLNWYKMYFGTDSKAEVLAMFELLEISAEIVEPEIEPIVPIPQEISPHLVTFRMEVLFWGIRNMKKMIHRPKMTVLCGESVLNSDVIDHSKKTLNFPNAVKSIDLIMAEECEYAHNIRFRLYDSRCFGVYTLTGIHSCDSISFLYDPMTSGERFAKMNALNATSESTLDTVVSFNLDDQSKKQLTFEQVYKKKYEFNCRKFFCCCCTFFGGLCKAKKHTGDKGSVYSHQSEKSVKEKYLQEMEDFDWWTKYYASAEAFPSLCENPECNRDTTFPDNAIQLKIYQTELENQPEFRGFTDMLTSFDMYKGKRTGDEALDEKNISGIFKGAVKIYRWPSRTDEDYVTSKGTPVKDGVFNGFPENVPLQFLLRVYIVRGIGLQPKDCNGKCDPYLCLTLNERIINDKLNHVQSQVNPTFGRCFEFENSQLPFDNTLTISVWDFDTVSSDDLIGETKIDLENRLYTKHRASCGIAESYHESGYCKWRDQKKPSAILNDLCKTWGVDLPEYTQDSVIVGSNEFFAANYTPSENNDLNREVLSLTALRRWQEMPVVGFHLVPEYVETRSLYHPAKPGIEQGKIQMWIDIFPSSDYTPPPMINIVPRVPIEYELRVIIWNTEDVILDDDEIFTGEKKSDIYVKGWLADPKSAQYTDVHYRSLTGEGNFNWRFVFPFEYLSSENRMVIRRKETTFSLRETELKIPCKLYLQVWDNDTFSQDDFLGSLCLELNRLPRGARSASKCSLKIMEKEESKLNLFKVRRMKGWWPFKGVNPHTKKEFLKGRVEAELELIEKTTAEQNPAGLGRQGPQGLPPPKRPDTSYTWFKNPLRSFRHCVCKVYRWRMICCCLSFLMIVFVLLFLYSIPGYSVKFILGL